MHFTLDSVTLELTAVCNLRCTICPLGRGELKRSRTLMPVELVRDILTENSHFTRVNLNNWGEPLLHPRFAEILNLTNTLAPQAKVYFATNATLLDDALSGVLLSAKIHEIHFSVDGVGPHYEHVRGTGYQDVSQRIRAFIAHRARLHSSVRVCIKAVVCAATEAGMDDLVGEWRGVVDEIRLQPLLEFGDRGSRRSAPCPELRNSYVTVLSDGRVTPCCADYNGALTIGHAGEETLESIWNGERAERLRASHDTGAFPEFCLRCTEYRTDKCAERFAVNGDPKA